MIRTLSTAAFLAAALSLPGQLSAQNIGDVESAVTRGSQFDDARQLVRQSEQRATSGEVIDGEAGVFILDTNDIFSIGAVGGIGFSTNPSRTLDVGTEDSVYGSLAVSAGVNTVIDGRFNAGLNLIASATEYERDTGPDFRNILLSGYVGKDVLDDFMFLNLGFSVGSNFNGNFGDATGFYGLSLSATKVLPIRPDLIAQFSLSIARNWSDASDQNNTTFSPRAEVIWAVAPRWRASASLNYAYRRFSDFFEDVTLTKRKDHQVNVSARMTYQILPNLDATAGVSYTKQESTFFISDFEEFDMGATLRMNHRF